MSSGDLLPLQMGTPLTTVSAKVEPIRFLTGYVGSKLAWVPRLGEVLEGRHIVEPFCGSAVLSSTFAASATLNDFDPIIARILSRFDEQIVPEVFTLDDYYRVRSQEDWWRYTFCLQRMSFSGVFRYSRNGFNVPAKKKELSEVRLRPTYERALKRWRELAPVVSCGDYADVVVSPGAVVVLDPPYEATQAAYNKKTFDYDRYWSWVRSLADEGISLLMFDTHDNLTRQGLDVVGTRKMRVNGAREGSLEALAVANLDSDLIRGDVSSVARTSSSRSARSSKPVPHSAVPLLGD